MQNSDPSLAPFPRVGSTPGYQQREAWPAKWITTEDEHEDSFASAYRLQFECEKSTRLKLLVTADQRYWLYLNGQRIGRGSERGSIKKWFYEIYEIELPAGTHTFGAITWYLSESAPWAQVTAQPGFLLTTTNKEFIEKISTGIAEWESHAFKNITFLDPTKQVGRGIGCGARILIHGRPLEETFKDKDQKWFGVKTLLSGNNAFWQMASPKTWVLHPAQLPAMREEKWRGAKIVYVNKTYKSNRSFLLADSDLDQCIAWQSMLDCPSESVEVPPHSEWNVLIDLGNYCCAYYKLKTFDGTGSEIKVAWAERLSLQPEIPKAPNDRKTIEEHFFVGIYDQFQPTGKASACYEPLWWQAGRWVQISIQTGESPLQINNFEILETGYPWKDQSQFISDDKILNAIVPLCYRTLISCTHETYMDCPYWEQLQYLGDTRIQSLLTYVTSKDNRLPEKALEIFRHSMLGASPFPASNYPSRGVQIIPPFALWWVCMLHDYAMWRGNAKFVEELLPMGWWIVDHFLKNRNTEGLIISPQGWNYIDSVGFPGGEPPGADVGKVSGLINWQVILALNSLQEMSQWLNMPERAQWADRISEELSTACEKKFWNRERSAFADDLEHTSYSEHSQSLAILSKRLSPKIEPKAQHALTNDTNLLRAGPYFSHYICQAFASIGADKLLHNRLHTWSEFLDAGFSTMPEHGVNGRSDCHAWSAHPLYHALSSTVGVSPASMGFKSVLIKPSMGVLQKVSGVVPHPLGEIRVELTKKKPNGYSVNITLPEGLSGTFFFKSKRLNLQGGNIKFEIKDD